jgi:hypothetical protein
VSDVAAELVVQLPHTHFGLECCIMWRHAEDLRRYKPILRRVRSDANPLTPNTDS